MQLFCWQGPSFFGELVHPLGDRFIGEASLPMMAVLVSHHIRVPCSGMACWGCLKLPRPEVSSLPASLE